MKKNETHHWKECLRCGEKTAEVAHTGGTATCTEKAKCDVCGQEYGAMDMEKHNFGEGQPTCSRCGDTNPNYTPPLPDTGTGDGDNTGEPSGGETQDSGNDTDTGDTSSGGENSINESASSILDKRLAELDEIIRSYREA